jgi:hypothetical protein
MNIEHTHGNLSLKAISLWKFNQWTSSLLSHWICFVGIIARIKANHACFRRTMLSAYVSLQMKPCKNTFNEVDMPTTSKGNDVKLCCYSIIILIILIVTPFHVSMDFKELVFASNNSMKKLISVQPCTYNLKDVNKMIRKCQRRPYQQWRIRDNL